MLRATIIGKTLCTACQDVADKLDDLGYEVTELDLDTDTDAMSLFALLDGDPENLPLVILRGLPEGGL